MEYKKLSGANGKFVICFVHKKCESKTSANWLAKNEVDEFIGYLIWFNIRLNSFGRKKSYFSRIVALAKETLVPKLKMFRARFHGEAIDLDILKISVH